MNKYHVWYGYFEPIFHACVDAYIDVTADNESMAEAKAKDELRNIPDVQIRTIERFA